MQGRRRLAALGLFAVLLAGCGSSNSNPGMAQTLVYVANQQSQTLSAYVSDPTTGMLGEIPGSPLPAGVQAQAELGGLHLAIDPQNQFLFVLGDKLAVFAIDAASGNLVPVGGSPFSFAGAGRSVAADPKGRFVYVSTDGGGIWGWSIDRANRTLVPIAGSPFGSVSRPDTLAIDPQGKFVYGSGVTVGLQVYSIGGSGSLAAVGAPTLPASDFPLFTIIHPSGNFAYLGADDNQLSLKLVLVALDALSGAVSGGTDLGSLNRGGFLSPNGKWIFVNDLEYAVAPTSGALTQLAPQSFGASARAAAFRADSKFIYVVSLGSSLSSPGSIAVYSLDPATGAVAVVASALPTGATPVDVVATR